MDSKKESLKSKIERLRHSFFAELPDRLDVVDKDFNQLELDPNNSNIQKELHRKIHNIKGTSASFGLKALSHIAIQIESLLKKIIEESHIVDEAIIGNIQSMLFQLNYVAKEIINSGVSENESFPAFELSADCLTSTQQQNNFLIFICDDDKSLLEYLSVQLDCFAYSTKGFTSTASLLKATEDQVPDIIIMDIVFPDGEQTGLECIKKIQQLHKRNIPVIFMSGRNDFEARLYAVQANGIAYFNKPFKVMDLVDTIDNILNPQESEPYRVLVVNIR